MEKMDQVQKLNPQDQEALKFKEIIQKLIQREEENKVQLPQSNLQYPLNHSYPELFKNEEVNDIEALFKQSILETPIPEEPEEKEAEEEDAQEKEPQP